MLIMIDNFNTFSSDHFMFVVLSFKMFRHVILTYYTATVTNN